MGEKPPQQKQTFDKRICERYKELTAELFLEFPELRSVAVALDYAGELNEARVKRGIWISDKGPVTQAAAIHGSIHQALHVLEQMFVRARTLSEAMREEMIQLGEQLIEKHKEVQNGQEKEKEVPEAERPAEQASEKSEDQGVGPTTDR